MNETPTQPSQDARPEPGSPLVASAIGGPGGSISTPQELSGIAQRVFRGGPSLLRRLQHCRPFICPFGELLSLVPPGSSVLDVGCGGGLWLALLRETGRLSRGVGFDSSKRAIDLAHTIEPSPRFAGTPLEFHLLPAQDPWPPGEFDVVSIIDVLHHVSKDVAPRLFALAMQRVKPGGILLYKDIYPNSWRSICNRMHDLALARQWINLVPTPRVIRWAQDAGFKLRTTREINTWWYGHVLCVFEK